MSNHVVIAILQGAGDPNSVTSENTGGAGFWIFNADVTVVHGFVNKSAVGVSYTHMSLPLGSSVGSLKMRQPHCLLRLPSAFSIAFCRRYELLVSTEPIPGRGRRSESNKSDASLFPELPHIAPYDLANAMWGFDLP